MSAEQYDDKYNGVARAMVGHVNEDLRCLEERVSKLEGELMSIHGKLGELRGEVRSIVALAAVVMAVVSGAIQIIGILVK
jgi:hypothetical protein